MKLTREEFNQLHTEKVRVFKGEFTIISNEKCEYVVTGKNINKTVRTIDALEEILNA